MHMNWSDSALPIFAVSEIIRLPHTAGIMLEVTMGVMKYKTFLCEKIVFVEKYC